MISGDHQKASGTMSPASECSTVATSPERGQRSVHRVHSDLEKGENYADRLEKDKLHDHNGDNKDGTEERDPNLVDWDGPDDPENPQNWPLWKKCSAAAAYSFMTMCITVASSIFSTATQVTSKEFGVSPEVMTLGTSLFVLGFSVGPCVWGPLSELYGRRVPLFIGFAVFAIFNIPVAVAQNVETIMLGRFLGGTFASAPLAIVGGALADFFDPVARGVAICMFSASTFMGPVCGPIIGSFITQSYLGWRWTAWIVLIMASSFGIIAFIIVPESYAPVLLQKRARKLRFETKNWALHAKADESRVELRDIAQKYLGRPMIMLVKEPILVLVTLYMSLTYGILYLFFEAYPIAFQMNRGWSPGLGSLPFLACIVGVAGSVAIGIWMTRTRFARKLEENNYEPVPEERLPAMAIGAVIFPIGLFWFAWTSNPAISWVPQVLAGIPIGLGINLIFTQGLNYLVDVYAMHANSAISANTFIRSLAGAGFPLFATPMFTKLGVNWAGSLLGFLAVACMPFPIIFYLYGERIRKLSKYSPT